MEFSYEEVFSFEHLSACARECLKGVTWKQSTQMFELNLLQWVASLHRDLLRGAYKSRGFNSFTISERGKTRQILSVHISERVVQKCLVTYCLKPLIIPRIITDNAATIEGRGTEYALKRLREHLRYHVARYGRAGGILCVDYHNYFGSINHALLIAMLRDIIKDDRLFEITVYFISCFPGDCGLGLGSEISQICAVFYPNRIDHYMKDRLRVHGYARYMDDSYAISDKISDLREYENAIKRMSLEQGLTLNEKVTHIARFDTDSFEYLKKRVFITEDGRIVMRLTPKNITQRRRAIKKHIAMTEKGLMTEDSRQQSFTSWKGYAEKYDSHNTILNMSGLMEGKPILHP